jgi:hypothetical protein
MVYLTIYWVRGRGHPPKIKPSFYLKRFGLCSGRDPLT